MRVMVQQTGYSVDVYVDGTFAGGITRARANKGIEAIGEALVSILESVAIVSNEAFVVERVDADVEA